MILPSSSLLEYHKAGSTVVFAIWGIILKSKRTLNWSPYCKSDKSILPVLPSNPVPELDGYAVS